MRTTNPKQPAGTYEQDVLARKAARTAAAQRIADRARQCACGAAGAIMLHNYRPTSFRNRWASIPACGPCAVALMEQGWSPDRSDEVSGNHAE